MGFIILIMALALGLFSSRWHLNKNHHIYDKKKIHLDKIEKYLKDENVIDDTVLWGI
jgi:hypothetical protein